MFKFKITAKDSTIGVTDTFKEGRGSYVDITTIVGMFLSQGFTEIKIEVNIYDQT